MKKKLGSIRIVSGKLKGRKIYFQDSEGLRPTADRAKETLFNWLMFKIHDKNILDLFAGSGNLSFESLSRGAAQIELIEKEPKTFKTILENISQLNATEINAINQDSFDYLTSTQKKFDIVFVDPPFNKELVQKSIDMIADRDNLNPDAYIYLETESSLTQLEIPSNWKLFKEKKISNVMIKLFQVNN